MIRFLTAFFLLATSLGWANSVSLFNDSPYRLNATLFDANGNMLGEFVLNSRDATEWSDDSMDFGTESQYAPQTPYTVDWTCMNGSPYGSCNDVAAGSVVNAQSCGGTQECQSQQQNNY